MKKTLSISFDVNDPLDKTLWNHLKNLPTKSRREFVLQSLLLNMHLPPIYQVCFLQSMLNASLPRATSLGTNGVLGNESNPDIQSETTPSEESSLNTSENSILGLTRDAFKV